MATLALREATIKIYTVISALIYSNNREIVENPKISRTSSLFNDRSRRITTARYYLPAGFRLTGKVAARMLKATMSAKAVSLINHESTEAP
jgi:hypothetical protein